MHAPLLGEMRNWLEENKLVRKPRHGREEINQMDSREMGCEVVVRVQLAHVNMAINHPVSKEEGS
jgi:hypothetical protein